MSGTAAVTPASAFPAVPGLDVEHRFVEARGVRFHLVEAGDGPPLLLLHGWPQHFWMWRHVMPSLAQRFRLVAPDLRGLGWSDAQDPYDKQTMADDALAIMDELGIDKARVMGHDWGGAAAALMAAKAPERVERAILIDFPPLWDTSYDPRQLLGIAHMPFLSLTDRLVPQVAELLLKRGSNLNDDEIKVYVDVLRQPERRRATVGIYRAALKTDLRRGIPGGRPDVPLRVIGGARDPVVRFSRGVELVRGSGHFLPEDKPDAVIGHALSFF